VIQLLFARKLCIDTESAVLINDGNRSTWTAAVPECFCKVGE
jgi:hypothetical protein